MLARLDVDDVVTLSTDVREVAGGTASMVDAAQRIVEHLHRCFVLDGGAPACPLVRIYATVRAGDLSEELRQVAEAKVPAGLEERVPCLTLLGTAGVEPQWCDRRRSVGHRTIPLVSTAEVTRSIPMVAGLLAQLGVDVDRIVELRPAEALVLHHRDYGVFHVPEADGSPLIPAQEFVRTYGVRSVIGCGGALPSGELFSLIAFSGVPLDASTAALFRTLAYGIKAALVPHTFRVLG